MENFNSIEFISIYFFLIIIMKVGSKSINIRNFTISDNEESRAPQSMKMGWFYLRVINQITPSELSNLCIKFNTNDMIQNGWYKKFLNEEQLVCVKKLNKFSLFPVKNYQKPDFSSLNKKTHLRVTATEDWKPDPPAVAKKEAGGIFLVTGQTAEKLFEDPHVCQVDEYSFATPI